MVLLLVTWINYNPSMDKQMPSKGEIVYPFPNFNGRTVKVWEWISNVAPHFIMNVITYPSSD